jgi:hypothetical protein
MGVSLITMALLPLIPNGVVALVVIALVPSSSWHRCPHHNGVVVIIDVIALVTRWQAGIAAVDAQGYLLVSLANVALVRMASLPLLMRRLVSAVVKLVLSTLPLVIKLVSSPTLQWRCCHQCAGFLPLLRLQFFP